jgi:lipid II:glycine glycyltransferase (peptidoglycan interpeptide bridge formation enzyme)
LLWAKCVRGFGIKDKDPCLNNQHLKAVVPTKLSSCNKADGFLQSGFWGSFKARFGWNARAFLLTWGDAEPRSLLVIRRRLTVGVSFAYVPWGPELPANFPTDDNIRNIALAELAKALQTLLPHNTAFIRFDPPWHTEGAETPPPPIYKPFSPAGADIQPPDTVLLDLTLSLDTLLSRMKSKWRYNIGLARKKGVLVRRAGEEELEIFYALLKETARRDGIAVHSLEYYQTLFSHCSTYPENDQEIALYLAEHEGDIISGVIVLFRGREAVYLYGASADRKRNLMSPYALQWKSMEDAKARGCEVYDLFGIPPREDPDHPMVGLYRFKTGFGGRIIHRPGSWDYAYRPLIMRLFTLAESFRKKLRTMKKQKRSRRRDSKKD